MKRKKRLLAVLFLMILLLTACATNSNHRKGLATEEKSQDLKMDIMVNDELMERKGITEEKPESAPGIPQKDYNIPTTEQFIIRTHLQIETEQFEESVRLIESIPAGMNGYIENVEANYGTTYDRNRNRYSSYTLRIPKQNLPAAIQKIKSGVGLVVQEQQTTENVTKQIRDTKRDIELLKAKEDRLIELTKKTDNIEALIQIESELAMIISEREYQQAALQNIEYDVKYDFLSIFLREVRVARQVQENSFLGDIRDAFDDSILGLQTFFQNLILFIVSSWPLLIFLALIIWLIVFLVKRACKKRGQCPFRNRKQRGHVKKNSVSEEENPATEKDELKESNGRF